MNISLRTKKPRRSYVSITQESCYDFLNLLTASREFVDIDDLYHDQNDYLAKLASLVQAVKAFDR